MTSAVLIYDPWHRDRRGDGLLNQIRCSSNSTLLVRFNGLKDGGDSGLCQRLQPISVFLRIMGAEHKGSLEVEGGRAQNSKSKDLQNHCTCTSTWRRHFTLWTSRCPSGSGWMPCTILFKVECFFLTVIHTICFSRKKKLGLYLFPYQPRCIYLPQRTSLRNRSHVCAPWQVMDYDTGILRMLMKKEIVLGACISSFVSRWLVRVETELEQKRFSWFQYFEPEKKAGHLDV